jgi:transcriptional regulator with XRE-family HTH domain
MFSYLAREVQAPENRILFGGGALLPVTSIQHRCSGQLAGVLSGSCRVEKAIAGIVSPDRNQGDAPMSTLDLQDPKFLGFWARCIREASHWSQEALAASSGLDVRTIQRIEAGRPINITTRRALARGLGYDDPNVFDDPAFFKAMQDLFDGVRKIKDEEVQQQFPVHVRVKVTKATTGEGLAQLSYNCQAYLFHTDEAISPVAKEIAFSIFDFLRDLGDGSDELSFSQKLGCNRELDAMLKRLEGLNCACFTASRAVKMVGRDWAGKPPIPVTVGYLTVVPGETVLSEMMVPRRLS